MNDYAGLLAPGERERLESSLAERERATGAQMAIALFRSLEGESLEDVAERLFQRWRLGQKGLDNGVLLVVFVQDRKLRLEVGYGLEAVLPDAEAGRIIREAVAPHFREQRYAAGLEAAVSAVYARVTAPRATPPGPTPPRERRGLTSSEVYLLMFIALVVSILVGLAWDASRQRGLTASRRGWRSSGPGVWYGGGWGGGGGGWSSGGGGFSGGGGSSGGGGASGSW